MNRYSVGPVRRGTAVSAGLLAMGVMLAGCSTSSDSAPGVSASAGASVTASASANASPSATSTLSAEEQQAFEEATEAVRAYKQTFYDILADSDPTLNDMNGVATQPALSVALTSLQQIVNSGETSVEATGPVVVTSAQTIRVSLKADPPTVLLLACVDSTAARGTDSGIPWSGSRESTQYRVVMTDYLPASGWAVAEVNPPAGRDDPAPC